MKPASLLGLALDLLRAMEAKGALPADARVGRFFRAKPFLGSHDRAFLGEVAYAWLRHSRRARARWSAWASRRGLEGEERTGQLLEDLVALARDRLLPWSLIETLAAAREHLLGAAGPEALPRATESLLELVLASPERTLDFLPEDCWPPDAFAARLSLPDWLARRLIAERGEAEARRLGELLLEPASVDLRVSLRETSREAVREELERETGIPIEPTPFSPLGLRLQKRKNLSGTTARRKGWIEVEDEGSQIIALSLDLCGAAVVVDACAGAGGKTLAVADILLGASGKDGSAPLGPRPGLLVIACDVAPSKLEELERRAKAAGVRRHIRIVPISADGALPSGVLDADLVLVDAPCSGLGTLRRNPDLKLRHGHEDVTAFAALQRSILERFSGRVKPGGRLAYSTCSILRAENEDVALDFAAAHPEFKTCPSEWARAHLPPGCVQDGFVHLDPALTRTDGFFLALWKRQG